MSKVIKLEEEKTDVLTDRVPLKIMRSIWNDNDNQYSDEQLLKMREWVYLLADVIFDTAKEKKRNNIIHLNPLENETEESNTIYPGEYRRAS